ncbi:MAG: minor capsid protein [Sarcina sp.]
MLLLTFYFLRLSKKHTKNLDEIKNKDEYEFKKIDTLKDLHKLLYVQARELNNLISKHLEQVYVDTFKQTMAHLDRELKLPNDEEIYKLTHATWVGNKNFEQRTYWNIEQVYKNLEKIIDSNISLEEQIELLNKLKSNYEYRIKRLVRTETMHIMNSATMRVYRACGVLLVRWITCMDEKECEICASRDMRIYPISLCPKYPDHPNCRCLLVAVITGGNYD